MAESAAPDGRAPCIIGVGRATWHPDSQGPDGAPEPLAMWEEVARAAAADAGAPRVLAAVQRLMVVYCQTWQYDDPCGRLAERIGAAPASSTYSGIGGSVPQVLLAEAAQSIMAGQLDVALLVGAEALATQRRLKKQGRRPVLSHGAAERRPMPFDTPFLPAEMAHEVFQAYLTFALFDSARRARAGTPLDEFRRADAELLANMSEVAAADPEHAWFPVGRSPEAIGEPGPENRMVAYPYTKLMTAIMDVDMAAGVLVASAAEADRLGVPPEQRVYLRGWGYAEDPAYVAERDALGRSVAMAVAAEAALAGAGVGIDDVAHLDLYSCFASSLGFALDALGLDQARFGAGGERSLTVTGGLPYHGGPGSNYMTHSVAAMAERLRQEPGAFGLVSGVGMHMTKHAFGLWSTEPGPVVPPDPAALARQVSRRQPVRPIVESAEGTATVAAYSVLHGADGAPARGVLVCDLAGGDRCYGWLEDEAAVREAESSELIGRAVSLRPDGAVNRAHL